MVLAVLRRVWVLGLLGFGRFRVVRFEVLS